MSDAMRLECLKAAASVAASHPDNEVAYAEDGKPIGATTVDIKTRVITMATDFEAYVKGQPSTLAEEAKQEIAATAPSEEKQETERVADFNVDQCPIHFKGLPSKYNTEMKPLFCGEEGCEWGRTDFFNEGDDGETKRVTKYRIAKGKNSWMFRDSYMDELRSRGIIE